MWRRVYLANSCHLMTLKTNGIRLVYVAETDGDTSTNLMIWLRLFQLWTFNTFLKPELFFFLSGSKRGKLNNDDLFIKLFHVTT